MSRIRSDGFRVRLLWSPILMGLLVMELAKSGKLELPLPDDPEARSRPTYSSSSRENFPLD